MQDLKNILTRATQDLYGLDFTPDFTPSPDNIDADYSTNAPLKLAKSQHKSPMAIAEELKQYLEALPDQSSNSNSNPSSDPDPNPSQAPAPDPNPSQAPAPGTPANFQITLSAPGFLNFTLSGAYLFTKITDFTHNFLENISSDAYSGQTVICEFSDPNPFKVLHVGHLYTSVVGDAISRLYEYAGAKVIRANFGGDVGLHVAKTMYALLKKDPDHLTIEDIARCYVEGTAAYDEDAVAKAEITRLNKEIYQINSEDLHGTPLADLYWRGRELSYDYFKAFYASIGVTFDKFYPESTVAGLGFQIVEEQLQKGVYELSDGAVIFNGEKFGLHTRVFINKEGVPTYETKDVGLIFTKYNDYHFDKSVVITGNEQSEYMKVVLKSVEQYAPDLVAKTTHLTHGLVKLPGNVKMSSRKGNFLKAVDVLNLVKDALQSEYNSTDATVSLAATKYAFLKYKMGLDIIFDPQESVKMTGNSGPYLLYSAVRASKILAKAAGPASTYSFASIDAYEKTLAKKLLEYKGVLAVAVSEMAPYKVANFLYELAQDFSRFYEHCPVVGSGEEAQRLELVQAYHLVITHGLNLLGIDIPAEM